MISPEEKAAVAREVLGKLIERIDGGAAHWRMTAAEVCEQIEQYRDKMYPEPRPTLNVRGDEWTYETSNGPLFWRHIATGNYHVRPNPITAADYRAAADCIEATERWLARRSTPEREQGT